MGWIVTLHTFFFLVGLGFQLRALCLQSQVFHYLSHTSSPFLLWLFLEMAGESHKLFAQAGLEL
jgi:hypothetical protein